MTNPQYREIGTCRLNQTSHMRFVKVSIQQLLIAIQNVQHNNYFHKKGVSTNVKKNV